MTTKTEQAVIYQAEAVAEGGWCEDIESLVMSLLLVIEGQARELDELRSAVRDVVDHADQIISLDGRKVNRLRSLVGVEDTTEETK